MREQLYDNTKWWGTSKNCCSNAYRKGETASSSCKRYNRKQINNEIEIKWHKKNAKEKYKNIKYEI